MPDTPVTFKVFRCAPGGEASRFDTFEVAVPGHASVLDALDAIRVDIDPTLVYRHSCHHSSCGTCAMRINGRDRLACITPALEDRRTGGWEALTPREREVLHYVAEGFRNREIADLLVVSEKTVEKHRANFMAKLGLHSAAEVRAFAQRQGLPLRLRDHLVEKG